MLILELDLGKFKSVDCWYTVETTHSDFETQATLVADPSRQLTK